MVPSPIVVLGAGLAGSSAVESLRREGYEGPITLVGMEAHLPYERPPLSKEVLREGRSLEQLITHDRDWYVEQKIETELNTRAIKIHPQDRLVELADGKMLKASGVLVATGSLPRRLPFPLHERIQYLRTYEDAVRIRNRLRPGNRMVVIGGGFIGAEVAAAACTCGVQVVMVELLDVPFSQVLGVRIGEIIADIHRQKGVDVRTGRHVTDIRITDRGVVVTTNKQENLEADFVVIGVGVIPNDEVARRSGIHRDDGIVVDAGCATSLPQVYAAGDVASLDHPLFGHHLRVEHYDSAIKQGRVAARNMLGQNAALTEPPWFWSDQYEFNLQYAGHAPHWEEVIVRGSPESRNFTAFFLKNGRLLACFGLNKGSDVRIALRLVGRNVSSIIPKLNDAAGDLRSLALGVLRQEG